MTSAPRLRPWVHDLRPRAIEQDGVLTFRPIPLFLALMGLFENGDRPEFEADVFSRLGNQLQFRELVSLSWWDYEAGPTCMSIVVAFTPEDGLLVLDTEREFLVVALGPERALQAIAAECPDLILPRMASRNAVLRDITIRHNVCWTADDLRRIVRAIVGTEPKEAEFQRPDLLTMVDGV